MNIAFKAGFFAIKFPYLIAIVFCSFVPVYCILLGLKRAILQSFYTFICKINVFSMSKGSFNKSISCLLFIRSYC